MVEHEETLAEITQQNSRLWRRLSSTSPAPDGIDRQLPASDVTARAGGLRMQLSRALTPQAVKRRACSMRLSPTPGSRPRPLEPVPRAPVSRGRSKCCPLIARGSDSPHQADGQFDGEHQGWLRERHLLRMVLSPIDVAPGLPQRHVVPLDEHAQDRRDGETAQQHQCPMGILPGLGPPAPAHLPLLYDPLRPYSVKLSAASPRAGEHAVPDEVRTGRWRPNDQTAA